MTIRTTSQESLRRCIAQVFLHGDLEVDQLGAFGVADATEVQVRAGERIADVGDVEEHESGLSRMGLDGLRHEL